jgi:acyl-CoA thioesterase-1
LTQHRPAIVVIELGGNDGLRGGDIKATRDNLDAMVSLAQRAGAKVLLVGMRLPPNYGPTYTRDFNALFTPSHRRTRCRWCRTSSRASASATTCFSPIVFIPSVAAQPQLLDNVWPSLEPLLGKAR